MRKIVYLIFVLSISISNAQDIIVKRNTEEIKVKVIEIQEDIIKYKTFDNLNGPVYSIKKSDVFFIKYKNGKKDVFGIKKNRKVSQIKGKLGTGYYLDDKKISKKEWLKILKTNDRAYSLYKRANTSAYLLGGASILTGFLVAELIPSENSAGYWSKVLIGSGTGMLVSAFIVNAVQKKAVKIYNSNKGVSYNLILDGNGVGLALEF